MNVALNDILTLTGRLDDAPGYDTPRERFRRFLVDRTAVRPALPPITALIREGQQSPREQERRAVQDLLVVLGRLLGFDTSFGSYERVAGTLRFDGLWRSKGGVDVTLDIRAQDQRAAGLDDLTRALAALRLSPRDAAGRLFGLCIVTPQYRNRLGLEAAVAALAPSTEVHIISSDSLQWLADATVSGRVMHEEVVQLLTEENPDFVIELMARMARPTEPAASSGVPQSAAEPAHWIMTIEPTDRTTADQFVRSVIGERHLLGLGPGTPSHRPRAGDWICFSVRHQGIVGRARIQGTPDAPPPLRDAHRFDVVYTLTNVDLYGEPVRVDETVDLSNRLRSDEGAPALASLTEEQFGALTTPALKDRRAGLRSAS